MTKFDIVTCYYRELERREIMGVLTISKPNLFLNDKIAKKILKNEKFGKQFSARIISNVIGADYEEVYKNIKKSSEEIAFSSLTVNSTADAIYYDDTCYFNIEINQFGIDSKPKQLESFVYQLYLGQLHTHHDYNKIKKIIQINIDAYDFYGYNEFMYNISLMEENHHFIASDRIHLIHLNLDYLRHLEYNNLDNQLMKDLYFLICGIDKLDIVYEGVDDFMKKIINEAKQIAGIEKMNLYLTDEEMIKNDQEYYKELGRQEGLQEGRQEEQEKIIIALHNNGASLELISKSSGLSLDNIKRIIDNSKK